MVASQFLLRPQSSGDTLFAAASEISYASGDTITLKGVTIKVSGQTEVIDATGEGDDFVTFVEANRVSGVVEITGHIVTGELVGFNNLPDEAVTVRFIYGTKTGTTHQLNIAIAITNLSIDWSRASTTVPVTVVGKITHTAQGHSIHEGAAL